LWIKIYIDRNSKAKYNDKRYAEAAIFSQQNRPARACFRYMLNSETQVPGSQAVAEHVEMKE